VTLTETERPVARRRPRDVDALLGHVPDPGRRFMAAMWSRRGRLLAFVLAAAVLSAGISLLLPRWYRAEATILPPTEGGSDTFGLMSALVENTALAKLGLFSSTTPSDIYVEILRSRTIREPLVNDFALRRVYDTKGLEPTLKELGSHIAISTSPSGIVTVQVEDRDPKRAADMTNEMVAGLDRFNRESVNTRAKRTREFLEGRLAESRTRMAQAESLLTAYEQKNKVVATTEAAAVGPMADVIAQKLSLEVRRSYMASYTRPGNASLREVDAEIGAMDRELARLPGLKQTGSRLALDAEIQRRVFTLITAQYEEARVQETRDTPTLTVLDNARVPEVRSRPKRALIVAGSTLVAALLAAVWVALTLRDPSNV
jgi:tyrosine-protein kinase Etk/Wzc